MTLLQIRNTQNLRLERVHTLLFRYGEISSPVYALQTGYAA